MGRRWLGLLVGVVARVWLSTLRLTVVVDPALRDAPSPWVLAFFHGTQFPLLAWRRRRPTVVMVSHSRDGELQSAALGHLGFTIVRGSSSRGGARALAALVRATRGRGMDAAFAVDGPRGPRGRVKGGAVLAARATGGVLVPMGSACPRGVTFARAWDAYRLPLPFSRVTVVLGAPLRSDDADVAERLERAIEDANARAGIHPAP